MKCIIPENFSDILTIDNAAERLDEAIKLARQLEEAGVDLLPYLDHAAIFADPPHLVTGPLKKIGYISGWDTRCYPSPVDGEDYINVPTGLPDGHSSLDDGWFQYVAVVHPVDEAAREKMLSQGYGNPFIHHLTWGIRPPERGGEDDLGYAGKVIRHMADSRKRICDHLNSEPGTLIMALPAEICEHEDFEAKLPEWLDGLGEEDWQVEVMQGGGFLIQFFVLTGGRIEVALRIDTQQTFNPKSVHKISEDEISTAQTD